MRFKQRIAFVSAGIVSIASLLSAQTDTINGTVVDSLLNAVMDSVTVASENVTVKTKDGGKFSLVVPSVRVLSTSKTQQPPRFVWNAVKGTFTWQGITGEISIIAKDMQGHVRALYASQKNSLSGGFSLANLPQGMYIVSVTTQGHTDAFRIVRIQGGTSGFFSAFSKIQGSTPAAITVGSVISKSYLITVSKPEYKTATITVAAGTPTTPGITVKLAADAPGGVPKTLPIVLFDGKTLNGWSGNPNIWSVKDSCILAKASDRHQQSLIITDKDYDDYRLYLTLRRVVPTNHPGVSFGSTRSTKMDTTRWDYNGCSVFMPPKEWTWDYRSNGGMSGITTYSNDFSMDEWHKAELLMHVSKGVGSMAVDGVLVVKWNNPSRGYKASPVGLQAHDKALEIAHKDISIEVNPTVDRLITLKK